MPKKIKKKTPANYDVHTKARPALLSSDVQFTDKTPNYRGLVNLAAIILVVVEIRAVIQNALKYGMLLQIPYFQSFRSWPHVWPHWTCFIALGTFVLLAYLIQLGEYAWSTSKSFKPAVIDFLHGVNITVAAVLPLTVAWQLSADRHVENLVPSFIVVLSVAAVVLKLISLVHFSHNLREELSKRYGKPAVARPSFKHLLYFIAAPTLCYQLTYPRTNKIRKRFVLRRVAEIIFCSILQVMILQQYVMPTLTVADKHIFGGSIVNIFERVLALAVPWTAIWLLGFYLLFQSISNLLGECLYFGDRLFYEDWWNSEDLAEYWRKWNLPVHNWALRHLYRPARRAGIPHLVALLIVFGFSAMLHELMVSIPCHMFSWYAFFGMLAQIPLIVCSQQLLGKVKPVWGNVIFWVSFCMLGQPFILLLLAADYARALGAV